LSINFGSAAFSKETLKGNCHTDAWTGAVVGVISLFATGIPGLEGDQDRKTRKRETTALSEAMAELGIKSGSIVTKNVEERIDTGAGTITVVPVWRFLLDLPESME